MKDERRVIDLDACGVMVRAAAVLGRYHAKQGWRPYRKWNTETRQRAYNAAHCSAREVIMTNRTMKPRFQQKPCPTCAKKGLGKLHKGARHCRYCHAAFTERTAP